MQIRVSKRIFETSISLVSYFGSWIIASKIFPKLIVRFTFLTVFAHEFAHFIIAKKYRAQPRKPIFLFLGIMTVGLTQVRRLHEIPFEHKRKIIEAGFIAGISCALSLMLYIFIYGANFVILPLILAIIFETYTITFGEDSKQWKTNTKTRYSSAPIQLTFS